MHNFSPKILAFSFFLPFFMEGAPVPAIAVLPSSSNAVSGTNQKLKDEQEKIALENGIKEQKLKAQLSELTAEKQRLELENSLTQQKQQGKLAAQQAEIERLTQEIATITKKLELDKARQSAKLDAELADMRAKLEKKKTENELASEELAARTRELMRKNQELELRMKELQLQKTEFDMQIAKFNTEIDLWEKREDWKNRVNREIEYTDEPLKGGVLTVSDRRISLNGPIFMDTADYICERIDYFNNQNPKPPIFIVIDSSPGGSVMAGYRILKAMEGSPAPVYVVLKSFAASMAACITTMAKKSFAYPNAIILHHQLLALRIGNLTEQRENVRELEEWWKRLATPIAAKMDISLDEFVKKMYANISTGDWREFADNAKKLKWIDEVVDTIREESLTKNPNVASNKPIAPSFPYLNEKTDTDGSHYKVLPRLEPFDCYYLYDPDGYYRIAK